MTKGTVLMDAQVRSRKLQDSKDLKKNVKQRSDDPEFMKWKLIKKSLGEGWTSMKS
jgi:hypothetical protein